MRELVIPAVVEVPPERNITDPLFENAASDPDNAAFSRNVDGVWRPVTTAQFCEEVRAVAAGLVSEGLQSGDRVAVISRTRYEWSLLKWAILAAGGVLVPIYETSSNEQVAWILGDSGAKGVFVETPAHAATVAQVQPLLSTPITVWGIDAGDLERLRENGRDIPRATVEARRRGRMGDDLAMIIYTSGTTGRPKGCALRHGGFLAYIDNLMPAGMDVVFVPTHSTLLFLPLAHSFAQIIEGGAIERRMRLGLTPNIKTIQSELASFQPDLLLSVPRVFEKVYNGAKHKAHAEGHGRIFDRAEDTALAYSRSLDAGGPGVGLRLRYAVYDRLVYRKIRAAMGGRVRYVISGGAALGDRLGHFFRGVGINVLEGYGLTETTAGGIVNLPQRQRIGSVGLPLPGMGVRIADDGEILMKGPLVFAGYWNNDEATGEAFTDDGWFRTGDIGHLDDDGFVFVTGRKKEIIVTSAGKNVAPTLLEDRIRAHPLVSQCLVVGDGRPYVAALITLDEEALTQWTADVGISDGNGASSVRDDPRLREEIQHAIDDANQVVSSAEAVKRFRILPVDFTEAGGELTPTMKLKRNIIGKEFAVEIDALYA